MTLQPECDPAYVRGLATRLLPQLDELADKLVERIGGTEPAYRSFGVVAEADLRRSCRQNLERIIQSLGAQVPEGVDPFDAPADTGRRRAAQGMPLEAVLHSYRLGGRTIWEGVVAVSSDDPEDPQRLALLRTASLVWEEIDRFSSALTEAYRHEELRRRTQHRSQQQADLAALVDGRDDEPFLSQVAGRLGIEEGQPTVSLVVLLDDPGQHVFALAEALATRGVHSVWAIRAGAETGLLRLDHRRREDLLALLQPLVRQRVGVSPVLSSLREVRAAHWLAELCAATLPRAEPRVVGVEERLPEAMVLASPELAELVLSRTVDLVVQGTRDADVLLQTVAVLLAQSGSYSQAGTDLYCHRNTVIARCERIAHLGAADPRTPQGSMLWSLALLASEQRDGDLARPSPS